MEWQSRKGGDHPRGVNELKSRMEGIPFSKSLEKSGISRLTWIGNATPIRIHIYTGYTPIPIFHEFWDFDSGGERRGYKTRETEGIKGCRKEMGERREKRAVKWWKGRVETEIASGGAVSLCKPDPLFGLGYIDFERVDTVCIKFWIIGRRCRVEDSNAPLTKLSLYTVPPAKLHLKFRAFVWSLLEFSDISPNNSVNCFIYIYVEIEHRRIGESSAPQMTCFSRRGSSITLIRRNDIGTILFW